MSAILIFETSTDTASLALAVDGEIIVEKSFTSDRRHNALLFEPLSEIIRAHGSHHFDAVLVGSGPGSYSGTRVGIAAAQGAALVAGCGAIAIPSILATPTALSGKNCLAVGDARRGSYWVAGIRDGQMTAAPKLTDSAGFEAALLQGDPCFSMEPIRGHPISTESPTARGLLIAWQNASEETREAWISQPPQPIYLAPPHITPSKKQVFG